MRETYVTLNPATVTIYSTVYYVIAVVNIVVTSTYMFAVIFKSKETMKSFRNLLIAGMPFLIYSTASITLTIPIYAYETCVFQLHGVIRGLSREANLLMTTSALICDQINTDLLLVMLINRYQIISTDFVDRSRYLFPGIYAFLAVTNVIQNVLLLIKLVLHKMIPVLDNTFMTYPHFLVITSAAILLSRLYAHIRIFFLNKSFAAKIKPVITPATFQLHTMLFRAVLSNILVTVVSKSLYLVLVVGILIDQSTMDVTINIISIAHNLSYICEMLITLYFVRPYREFICGFFRRRAETPITVFRSET